MLSSRMTVEEEEDVQAELAALQRENEVSCNPLVHCSRSLIDMNRYTPVQLLRRSKNLRVLSSFPPSLSRTLLDPTKVLYHRSSAYRRLT